MKNYAIIINNNDPRYDSNNFFSAIKKMFEFKVISGWWHYLSGSTYLVRSKYSANELYEFVKKDLDANFLIVEINTNNRQGWLPKKAWEWLRKNINQQGSD